MRSLTEAACFGDQSSVINGATAQLCRWHRTVRESPSYVLPRRTQQKNAITDRLDSDVLQYSSNTPRRVVRWVTPPSVVAGAKDTS